MQAIIIGKIANFEPGGQKQKGVHVFCKGLRSRGKKKYSIEANSGK